MSPKKNNKTDQKKNNQKQGLTTPDLNALGFWKGVGEQLNDNPLQIGASTKRFRYAFMFAVFTAGLISFFMLNSAYIFTQTILHVDDRVLSTAMEVNPDAVAYALNNMNIGE